MTRRFHRLVRILVLASLAYGLRGCDKMSSPPRDTPSLTPSTTHPQPPQPERIPVQREQVSAQPAQPPVRPVRLLVVDDPPLADAIEERWKAHSGQPLALEQLNRSEWHLRLEHTTPTNLAADALIFPPEDIGSLIEYDLLLPLPDFVRQEDSPNNEGLAESDIFMSLRRGIMLWGESPHVIPLGSGQLLLAYNRSLTPEGEEFSAPKTWTELATLASQGESPSMAQPLGQGWGAKLLVVRAAAYVKEPGRFADVLELGTVRPLLTEPPFVRALDELVADQRHCVAECIDWTPHDVMSAVQEGRIRLGLGVFPKRSSEKETAATIAWGLAPLPGSAEVYRFSDHSWETLSLPRAVPVLGIAGRVAGVVRGTRRQKAAWNVLVQLSGKTWGSDVCSQGNAATPFRISQLARAGRWLQDGLDDRIVTEFSQSVRSMLTASATLVAPRIPRAHDYMAELDIAVRQAVLGEKTSLEALQSAAEAWEKITASIGRPQQAENLMRHYGLSP